MGLIYYQAVKESSACGEKHFSEVTVCFLFSFVCVFVVVVGYMDRYTRTATCFSQCALMAML